MSDEEVIRRISRYLVPVALNLFEVRKAKGAAGAFFREIQKQRPDHYQGMFVVHPGGKVLASNDRESRKGAWLSDIRRMLDDGLGAFGEVPPRTVKWSDPLPFRGAGIKPDGSIVLAVSLRPLLLGFDRRGFGWSSLDSIPLTKEEAGRLSVPNAEEDAEFEVPARVVRKFYRVLSPHTDHTILPTESEVSRARLTGTVERIRGGIAYLRFRGSIAGTHIFQPEPDRGKKIRAAAALRGVGSADAKTGKLLSVTIVADGRYRHFASAEDQDYGAVAEWRAER